MRLSCDVRSVSNAEWSQVQSAAAKLDGELSNALNKLRRACDLKQQALKARLNASARLLRLEKVREKVRSKELRLVKQGLAKLEAEEAKMGSAPIAKETELNMLVVDPPKSPLTALFFGELLLLMLPNLFSSDTPIPFL